jgi:hypothetical protein
LHAERACRGNVVISGRPRRDAGVVVMGAELVEVPAADAISVRNPAAA